MNFDNYRSQEGRDEKGQHILILKTVLFTLGVLAVAAFLLFEMHRGITNEPIAQSSTYFSASQQNVPITAESPFPSDSNLMPFKHGQDTFALNLDSLEENEILGKYIFKTDSPLSGHYQLSKTRIYFQNDDIYVFDRISNSITYVNLPRYNDKKFLLMKPELTSVTYIYADGIGTETIRHYDLNESRVIHDYPHNCPGNSSPILLEQISDGSKIFYQCSNTNKVYLKTLGNTAAVDQLLFSLQRSYNALISPDNSKLILYNSDINFIIIFDFDTAGILSNAKRITFNVDPSTFVSFAFSNDGRLLYAISAIDSGHRLFTIEFQDLLDVMATGLFSYNIGRGRKIRLSGSPHSSFLPSSTQPQNSVISKGPRYTSGLNLLLFDHENRFLAVNPHGPELISQMFLMTGSNNSFRYQLSMDGERIYYKNDGGFCVFNFINRSFGRLHFQGYNDKNFLIMKQPGPDSILYSQRHSNGTYTIRHFNIDESSEIFDYPQNCANNGPPALLDQFSDGTKILYICEGSNRIFMKTLNNTGAEDQRLFKLDRYYYTYTLLSPDNSKLILYQHDKRYWLIKDLDNHNQEDHDTKRVYFNDHVKTFKSISFASDNRTIYAICGDKQRDPEFKLFTIDFRKVLENDYSNEQAPYNLGQGHLITIV